MTLSLKFVLGQSAKQIAEAAQVLREKAFRDAICEASRNAGLTREERAVLLGAYDATQEPVTVDATFRRLVAVFGLARVILDRTDQFTLNCGDRQFRVNSAGVAEFCGSDTCPDGQWAETASTKDLAEEVRAFADRLRALPEPTTQYAAANDIVSAAEGLFADYF